MGWHVVGSPGCAHSPLGVAYTDVPRDKLDLGRYRDTEDAAIMRAFDMQCAWIVRKIYALEMAIAKLNVAIIAIDSVGKYDLCGCSANMFGRSHKCGHDERRAAFAALYEVRERELATERELLAYFMPVLSYGDWCDLVKKTGSDPAHVPYEKAWQNPSDLTIWIVANGRLTRHK